MMLKEQLFSNWYPMRWFMLILGFVLGYNFLASGSSISGLLSLVILFQALTNTGCLLGHCTPAVHHQTKSDLNLDDVTFEEIKTD
ncbi:hypothetical protein [Rhodohalobacter sp. 614A]|uniref:hypothetical protein n=1 Tax=Rhodohalobacter sp. 614A TaxID=2908649 RepID=UPI001F441B5E|nr:hypothetical protein [Rhodohalobacter sp. 614A]